MSPLQISHYQQRRFGLGTLGSTLTKWTYHQGKSLGSIWPSLLQAPSKERCHRNIPPLITCRFPKLHPFLRQKKNRFYFINSLHKFLPLLQDWPYSVVSLPPLFLIDKNEPDSSCLFFYDRGIKKLRGRKMLCATDPIRIPLIWPWGTKIAHSIPNALAGKSSATARATHLFTSFQNHNCYFILEEIKGIRLFKTHFNIRKVIKSTSQNLEHLCIFSQQFILILLYESNSPQPYCLIA